MKCNEHWNVLWNVVIQKYQCLNSEVTVKKTYFTYLEKLANLGPETPRKLRPVIKSLVQ